MGYNETLFTAEIEVNEQTDEAKFTLITVKENFLQFSITVAYKEKIYTYSDIIYLATT